MGIITVCDKRFEIYIQSETIDSSIDQLAERISQDLKDLSPIFIFLLNGSFMFAADLAARLDFPMQFSFAKLASYSGTCTTNKISELIGVTENLEGRHVVIVDDIIETGFTMKHVCDWVKEQKPASIRTCAMFFKPEALKADLKVDYWAMELKSDFIVGHGLDYNGFGRNSEDIYKITD